MPAPRKSNWKPLSKSINTTTIGGLHVSLSQQGRDRFTVKYGLQIKNDLSYAAAATEFGCCVFHALACNSQLDNRTRHER